MKKEIVRRVSKEYVCDDCIQVLEEKNGKCMTIVSKNGLEYHCKPGSLFYVNSYEKDNRRVLFPYNNISTYTEKNCFRKKEYINKIYNFDQTYIKICGKDIYEIHAVKDGDEALLVSKRVDFNDNFVVQKLVTREELETYVNKSNINFYDFENGVYQGISSGFKILSENEILELCISIFKKSKEIETNFCNKRNYKLIGYEIVNYDAYHEIMEKLIDRLTINDVVHILPPILSNYVTIDLDNNKNDIGCISKVDVTLIDKDKYKVIFTKVPVSSYSLARAKELEQKKSVKVKILKK